MGPETGFARFGNPETIRANLRIDSRESGHLRLQGRFLGRRAKRTRGATIGSRRSREMKLQNASCRIGWSGSYREVELLLSSGFRKRDLAKVVSPFFPENETEQKRKKTEKKGRKRKKSEKIGSDTVPATPFAKPRFLREIELLFSAGRMTHNRMSTSISNFVGNFLGQI